MSGDETDIEDDDDKMMLADHQEDPAATQMPDDF